ncbi:MAG: two component transcriptional regulator, winged helix family [Acidobacteria bacterium]|jgi:DNA-binding response OmpR family regulator|nr:two component transcriptional regulator, winged helix family [Acidobacteriota bacterium]
MNRILIIDDDEDLCELISEYLSPEGFEIKTVHEGERGLQKALTEAVDLIILDVMLPKKNGFDVLRELRQTSKVPVLMLTARGDDMERIVGLESGADDYLAKPFNPRELLARIRAILRRVYSVDEGDPAFEKINVDDLEISMSARSAKREGEDLNLTSVEFDLLTALIKDAGRIVKKEDLSRKVLERDLSPFDRSLDMHISNLRKKLGKRSGEDEERIKTIRSVGYIYTVL